MSDQRNDEYAPVKEWAVTFTAEDFDWLEFAMTDYIAKWGEHLTGRPYMGEFGPNLAGIPTACGNMAGTVIRKWVRAKATGFRPVAHILDRPLGVGVEWVEGVSYDDDPALDDGTLLYVRVAHSAEVQA